MQTTSGTTQATSETTCTHTLTAPPAHSSGTIPDTTYTGASATASTCASYTGATHIGASTATPSRPTYTSRRYRHGPTAYTYTTPFSGNASATGSVAGTHTSYDVNLENLQRYTDSKSTKRKLHPSTFKSIIPKTTGGSPDSQYRAFVPDGYRTTFKTSMIGSIKVLISRFYQTKQKGSRYLLVSDFQLRFQSFASLPGMVINRMARLSISKHS